MTNEEAIEWLKEGYPSENWHNDEVLNYYKAIELAIKALEQQSVLDKIREDIKALSNANPSYWHSGDMVEREEVFDIIDKYKESEE